MTDSLGVVCTVHGAKYAGRMVKDMGVRYLFELPARLQDVPDGWIVCLDRDGRVQAMPSEEWAERIGTVGQ